MNREIQNKFNNFNLKILIKIVYLNKNRHKCQIYKKSKGVKVNIYK